MNCEDCIEKLVEYAEGLLLEPQRLAVESHLKNCLLCAGKLDELNRLSERLNSDSKAWQQTDVENKVLGRIIREQNIKLKQVDRIQSQSGIWRIIMRSKITKLAVAAAVIIIALLVGTYWFGKSIDGTTVALGKVIEKVEQIQNFSYQLKCIIKGMPNPNMPEVMETQVQVYYSSTYGYRFDVFDGKTFEAITYVLPVEKRIVNIMPAMKTYAIWDFSGDLADGWYKTNPKKITKEILEQCTNGNFIRSWRQNINGIETEGMEFTDPNGMKVTDPDSKGLTFDKACTKIWVDVRTDLPVLLEKDCSTTNSSDYMKIVINFKWDIELDKSIFEPNISEDYVLDGTGPSKEEMNAFLKNILLTAQ